MSFSFLFQNCSPDLQLQVTAFINEWNRDELNFEVQTSGSSGLPKTINLTKKQLEASAKRTNAYFNLTQISHSLCCLPFHSIAGKMQIVRALVGNYTVHIVEPKIANFVFLNGVEEIDFVSVSPAQLMKICSETSEERLLKTTFLLGGSALSSAQETVFQKSKLRIFQGFGMTETVSHFALKTINQSDYELLEGVSISANSEQTVFSDTLLGIENLSFTDILEFSSEKYFRFIGRRDFAINSGGIKIHPEPIEKSVFEQLNLAILLLGIPDQNYGEICVCVSEIPINKQTKEELAHFIRENFSPYAVPKYYFQHLFERGNYDKLLRRKTRERILKMEKI